MFNHELDEVVRELKNPHNVKEIENLIRHANGFLMHEAKRMGMKKIPALPNPKDTAAKLAKLVHNIDGKLHEDPRAEKEFKRDFEHEK